MPLPSVYTARAIEKHWQDYWLEREIYAWDETQPRENTFVIDTPPPTVSGMLHMGHIFSYTQADFVARFQRMLGKTVFYPMGFDDNGLPTERLVEKVKKIRANDVGREKFIEECESVAEEARGEFRTLFRSVALSVDWKQEYHTISEECRRLSQLSFLDLLSHGHAYRELKPFFWDPVDQTAIASAEIEDKELPSHFVDIRFGIADSNDLSAVARVSVAPLARDKIISPLSAGELGLNRESVDSRGDNYIVIGTTRPEMIPACVGVFYHPDDERYTHLEGKYAVTPLFGVKVPILPDETVEPDKGTGIMMCCTFGDEKDIEKWRKHKLATRVILNKYGKLDPNMLADAIFSSSSGALKARTGDPEKLDSRTTLGVAENDGAINALANLKVSNPDPKHPGARQKIIEMLREAGALVGEPKPIVHAVKCAERSGAPLEILPTHQWFVKLLDKKDALKAKAAECDWKPPYMRIRIDQWIEGLNQDWCISRQRFFGVPFPVWYSKRAGEEGKMLIADAGTLPVNPLVDVPEGYTRDEVTPDTDVMDTWATSSISPQMNAGAIKPHQGEKKNDREHDRFNKLFPADVRPQAHEIIRTWAFYTIVKAHLHTNTVPWKHLMISGWCLAADKTKMSKSKGNVVTPVALIEEKGADAVRYWASTSRLGADTAFSEDLLKIGKKLVTKLWNAAQLVDKVASCELQVASDSNPCQDGEASERTTHSLQLTTYNLQLATLDQWILTRLHRTVEKATTEFLAFEYCDARAVVDDFFWNDFCDNYLELVKARAYGILSSSGVPEARAGDPENMDSRTMLRVAENDKGQQSALTTLRICLNTILKLYAPFLPHVTEEIFSHMFAEEYKAAGSVHARGMWPTAEQFVKDETAEMAGSAAVQILNTIRKAKSERNLSIKFPLAEVVIAPAQGTSEVSLEGILEDIRAASNALHMSVSNVVDVTHTSENGQWNLAIIFAEHADTA